MILPRPLGIDFPHVQKTISLEFDLKGSRNNWHSRAKTSVHVRLTFFLLGTFRVERNVSETFVNCPVFLQSYFLGWCRSMCKIQRSCIVFQPPKSRLRISSLLSRFCLEAIRCLWASDRTGKPAKNWTR